MATDPADLRVLTDRRHTADAPYDRRPVGGTSVDDLDLELFRSTYLPSAVHADMTEENPRPEAQQLASLRFMTLDGTATVVGLLVTGYDPSRHIPGAYIQFVRYQGTDF